MADRDLAPGSHHCHRCKRVTVWSSFRGVQRCDECTDRFPCNYKGCGHTDCVAAREAHGSVARETELTAVAHA